MCQGLASSNFLQDSGIPNIFPTGSGKPEKAN
jgi:hypothetical protein